MGQGRALDPTAPIAAHGVLYVATWKHLYAIAGKEKNAGKNGQVMAK